jgi:hypothetical protein
MDSASKKKAAWKIAASSACRHAEMGARAGFSLDNTDICNGLLVKLTFSFSVGSTMAPPVIRVAGLSEAELPVEMTESPMLIVQVSGLCVGSSVDLHLRDVGYIVFMRSTSKDQSISSDQIFFEWYYEDVFRKFVANQRKLYDRWEEGTTVEPELIAVSWNDGDIPQLAAHGEAKRLEEYCEARIRTCKQNAARTGSDQATDVCRVFLVIKLLQKKTTLKDQSTPLK